MHAREWISPSTAMFIARDILSAFDKPSRSQRQVGESNVPGVDGISERFGALLEQFDFFIIPVVNPDGYDFSHSTHLPSWLNVFSNVASSQRYRMWRKNKAALGGGYCDGVDLNRQG